MSEAGNEATEDPVKLIVLDRGFVFACRCPDVTGCGLWITVKNARCVRSWGTSNGLGELCGGPLSNTTLDDLVPSMTFAVRALLFVFDDVSQDKWAPHLESAKSSRRRKVAS